jgi:hypothetical protein
MEMHIQAMGQLSYIADGAVRLRTHDGRWVVPKGRVIWIPAKVSHAFSVQGESSSWQVLLPPKLASLLPNQVCVLAASLLLFAALDVLIHEQAGATSRRKVRNLVAVIRDELRLARTEPLNLQLPRSLPLRKVTDALLANPAEKRGIDGWAKGVGCASPKFHPGGKQPDLSRPYVVNFRACG